MKTLFTDVAVIGAGPVGCVAALAFAHSGAKVLLLEAHPQTARRLAGEWLHPPSLTVLERLGVLLSPQSLGYPNGQGFVIFPDDGTQAIQLSYPNGAMALSCEHGEILSALRETAAAHRSVSFMPNTRVSSISAQKLTFENGKYCETLTILAERIIGADGRASVARKALGIPNDSRLISWMAGVLLEDVELPFEGFGHVFLGGPGPVLTYRIGKNQIRVCLDVPLYFKKKPAVLWDVYSRILPEVLLSAFCKALENSSVVWAANQYSARTHYGREGLALVGDATGYFHPMTATGMTVGFMDVECLVKSKSFENYQRQRSLGTCVPEMLATTLYEVFCRNDDSAIAMRKTVYKMWRQNPIECRRTMWLLSGAETNLLHFGGSFLKGVAMAVVYVIKDNASKCQWRHMIQVLGTFGQWLQSPIAIALSRLRDFQRINYSKKLREQT